MRRRVTVQDIYTWTETTAAIIILGTGLTIAAGKFLLRRRARS